MNCKRKKFKLNIEMKNYSSEGIVKKVKKQDTNGEKIFAKLMSKKGLFLEYAKNLTK